jgi:hypothetical protein
VKQLIVSGTATTRVVYVEREGELLLPESEDCFYQSQSFGKRRATLPASLMRWHNRTLNYKSMKIAASDIVRSSEASVENAAQARAHDGPGYGCHICVLLRLPGVG